MSQSRLKAVISTLLHALVGVSLLCGLMMPPAVQGQESPTVCPPAAEQKTRLEQRREQLNDTRERLVAFISGNQLDDVPPASLFVVDLNNEAAVATRIEQLSTSHDKPELIVADDPLLQCAMADEKLMEPFQALVDSQWQVNELRLHFLSLPQEQRMALVNAQKDYVRHSEAGLVLEQERLRAEVVKLQARQAVAEAQERAKSAISSAMRELASQRALLEKAREDLAATEMRLTANLQVRTRYYQETAERLSSLAGSLSVEQAAQSWERYNEVAVIWRELVDRIFERMADPASYEPLPQLPEEPAQLLERLANDEQAQQYAQAYAEVEAQYRALSAQRASRFEAERDNLYRLLLQAGQIRSQLVELNVEEGDGHVLRFSEQYFNDAALEVRVVPYHLLAAFYSKMLDFRRQVSGGIEGWLYIANQSALLLVALAFPFVIYALLRRFSNYLNELRRALIRGDVRTRYSKGLAIWIHRLNPYVPWVMMLWGLGLLEGWVDGTAFADLSAFIPYLAYYFWYRIFLLLIFAVVGVVAHSGAMEVATAQRARIGKVARQIGIFFVTALALLHATEGVVGKALVYRAVSDVMFYVGTLVCALAAWQWRQEISVAGERVLPAFLARQMPRLMSGWRAFLFSLPALLLVVLARLVEFLIDWAGEFDFFKRLNAELFRRRIQNNEGDGDTAPAQAVALPPDYLTWFDLTQLAEREVFIEPDNDVVMDVTTAVESWSRKPDGEHAVVLHGDKGGGKTTLLHIIRSHITAVEVLYLAVPPRLHTRESVLRFFGDALGIDLGSGGEALLRADAGFSPRVVMVDEAHNLFLSKLGGFEGYRAFLELVNLPTRNLFWCSTFNRRTWHYLDCVFGGSQQFRKVIEIPPLSDDDVRKLIMTRHQQTSYRLLYDEIIRATQGDDEHIGVTQVETQFFRLLWGQANGNPRAAMALWLTSLRYGGGNRLRVGVPRYQPVKGLEKAGDDAWFVYAEILRHENISIREAVEVTNLPEGVVRGAIKIGIEARALMEDRSGRFHVTPNAQFYLNQLLARKNFIYE